jgi:hypothetical protein
MDDTLVLLAVALGNVRVIRLHWGNVVHLSNNWRQLIRLKNIYLLVRILISFLFANDDEIGYDLTVERHIDPNNHAVYYIYEVGGRYFRTKCSLYEYRPVCISTRATRVWEVVEVDRRSKIPKNRRTMVLKDAWVPEGTPTEQEVQSRIFDELEKFQRQLEDNPDGHHPKFANVAPEVRNDLVNCLKTRTYANYFLTIEINEKLEKSKAIATGAKHMHQPFVVRETWTPAASATGLNASRSTSSTNRMIVELPTSTPRGIRDFQPKQQHRAVFREKCKALDDVDSLENVLEAMEGALFGERYHQSASVPEVFPHKCALKVCSSCFLRGGFIVILALATFFGLKILIISRTPKSATSSMQRNLSLTRTEYPTQIPRP